MFMNHPVRVTKNRDVLRSAHSCTANSIDSASQSRRALASEVTMLALQEEESAFLQFELSEEKQEASFAHIHIHMRTR